MLQYHTNYEHLCFQERWTITKDIALLLGESIGIIHSITNTPILPEYRRKLLAVALIKGAQATTAIEGNTLTYEEIENIQSGGEVPPSKEYQKQEVRNVITALNTVLRQLVFDKHIEYITPNLLKRFHEMIGRNIGMAFDATPGSFRKRNVIVGNYRPPSSESVPKLIDKLCVWIKKEFQFGESQKIEDAIIQAIVTHLYIAWIHPFSDGNGRTARLVEFFILMRAGIPDIASHILSNHYNETRTMYYRQIEHATQTQDLTKFIFYALQGFRDGLVAVLEQIQESQLVVSWKSHIFDVFKNLKKNKQDLSSMNKRRRELILSLPMDTYFDPSVSTFPNKEIENLYRKVSGRTFLRDIEFLRKLKLLSFEKGKGYRPYFETLKSHMALSIEHDEQLNG
ncbi:Fic family protein [Sediminispirochaeta smaragdinae]|uniref:Filamentation induced by cAMP protein Fic n=1 Tax=Sediminispirochaeta smaragdinae (strain DSM 11293 / JCM 15392 / SEBR 4228) TaxID=573413 RepID=E1RC10_SEDSS|nr:Fic family protein [Sediminispirochaeta smaragdinae]ADK79890.1 filamentation induced by cAMP protein Fic [Sediminispirochaeta smaragdinae DSM 11293]